MLYVVCFLTSSLADWGFWRVGERDRGEARVCDTVCQRVRVHVRMCECGGAGGTERDTEFIIKLGCVMFHV